MFEQFFMEKLLLSYKFFQFIHINFQKRPFLLQQWDRGRFLGFDPTFFSKNRPSPRNETTWPRFLGLINPKLGTSATPESRKLFRACFLPTKSCVECPRWWICLFGPSSKFTARITTQLITGIQGYPNSRFHFSFRFPQFRNIPQRITKFLTHPFAIKSN